MALLRHPATRIPPTQPREDRGSPASRRAPAFALAQTAGRADCPGHRNDPPLPRTAPGIARSDRPGATARRPPPGVFSCQRSGCGLSSWISGRQFPARPFLNTFVPGSPSRTAARGSSAGVWRRPAGSGQLRPVAASLWPTPVRPRQAAASLRPAPASLSPTPARASRAPASLWPTPASLRPVPARPFLIPAGRLATPAGRLPTRFRRGIDGGTPETLAIDVHCGAGHQEITGAGRGQFFDN